jgi:hypothetical protein
MTLLLPGAGASRHRLELANQANALEIALDAADSINAKDSLEKMLVHEMAVLHRGMMKAAARMNEELDSAGVIDPTKVVAGNKVNGVHCERMQRRRA